MYVSSAAPRGCPFPARELSAKAALQRRPLVYLAQAIEAAQGGRSFVPPTQPMGPGPPAWSVQASRPQITPEAAEYLDFSVKMCYRLKPPGGEANPL